MDEKLSQLLLNEIKSKKQIKGLEDKYIKNKFEKYFLTNGDIRKKLEKEFEKKSDKIIKNKIFKIVIKSIRQEIGIVYGSFLTEDFLKKDKILTKIKSNQYIYTLLKLHKSTKERLDFYPEIYEKIFNWYKPEIIADLACGLNPLAYNYIPNNKNQKIKYLATDLNPNDMNFLNEAFKKLEIPATAKNYDITTLEILKDKQFQSADLVFLFKALDSLEKIKKNISKQLITNLNAKKIVISFPTKSLISKKIFKIEKRNWFFNFLEKENYNYEKFEIENEIFILITK